MICERIHEVTAAPSLVYDAKFPHVKFAHIVPVGELYTHGKPAFEPRQAFVRCRVAGRKYVAYQIIDALDAATLYDGTGGIGTSETVLYIF